MENQPDISQANVDTLITVYGGSGFLGRHVIRALCKRGYRIRVAVRRPDWPATCNRSAGSARSTRCRPTSAIRARSRRRRAAPTW